MYTTGANNAPLFLSVELPADVTYRYARASGDDNRIHVDDEFAKSTGLPGIIVQGMCLFSIALQAVVETAGGPTRVGAAAVRFRRPVLPGTRFETRTETRFARIAGEWHPADIETAKEISVSSS